MRCLSGLGATATQAGERIKALKRCEVRRGGIGAGDGVYGVDGEDSQCNADTCGGLESPEPNSGAAPEGTKVASRPWRAGASVLRFAGDATGGGVPDRPALATSSAGTAGRLKCLAAWHSLRQAQRHPAWARDLI